MVTLNGVQPNAIINYDETKIMDDPGIKKVVVRRGSRHSERISDTSKSSTSVMFNAAADGKLLPPYVTYKAENLYNTWTEGGPRGTVHNQSKNGWFTLEIFEDWFRTIVLPYFRTFDKDEKKVMISDNLASHISLCVVEECKKKNNIKQSHRAPTDENGNVWVEAFETYLEESRKKDTEPFRKQKKRKLNFPPGRGIYTSSPNVSEEFETQVSDTPVMLPKAKEPNRKIQDYSSDNDIDSYLLHDSDSVPILSDTN
ncbi:hypothetical protein PR048_023668 [Dryococelus australis]|uniref:DDE-1 domain-containing protein n=1 Tax=Dryococelus australis TaxID=614101 RepID=A0ABQ9GUX7_9NEOP|nr:hypothetical protein PR048_023668 [Dryococelus australis]